VKNHFPLWVNQRQQLSLLLEQLLGRSKLLHHNKEHHPQSSKLLHHNKEHHHHSSKLLRH